MTPVLRLQSRNSGIREPHLSFEAACNQKSLMNMIQLRVKVLSRSYKAILPVLIVLKLDLLHFVEEANFFEQAKTDHSR